jgi:hypothetical protein
MNNSTFENNSDYSIFSNIICSDISISYYFYIYYEKLKEFVDFGTIVSLAGLIVVLIKMLWNLLNEPTLEFGDITNNNEPAYFITIKKKRGKGLLKIVKEKSKSKI